MYWLLTAAAIAAPIDALPPTGLAWASPADIPTTPCGTHLTMPDLSRAPIPMLPHAAPPAGEKDERDASSADYPNTLRTDNFVAKWGNSGGVNEAQVDRLLEAFETAWSVEVDDMGHPGPYGTSDYRFNVYIGDTGDGAPDGHGAGGYFSSDRDGWPIIVVAANTLSNPEYADITAAHEFYHAIQGNLNSYDYYDVGAWYWEATATWASAQVFPSNLNYSVFLFGYAFLPHYPVNFFDYPDQGQLQEYHQYGAFLFPLYLTESVADITLIRDTWVDPGSTDDPMESLANHMADRGLDFNAAWMDHVAHNARWDYPMGEGYRQYLDWYGSYYGEADNMVAARFSANGTDGWQDGPARLMPRRYGYNALLLESPDTGPLRVEVDGAPTGSDGSDSIWSARVVVAEDDLLTYHDVPFNGLEGQLEIPIQSAVSEVWLMVGVHTDRARRGYWDSESFAYEYQITANVRTEDDDTGTDTGDISDPSDDTGSGGDAHDTGRHDARPSDDAPEEDLSGCNCATGGAAPMGLWAGLMMIGALLRRRQRSSIPS